MKNISASLLILGMMIGSAEAVYKVSSPNVHKGEVEIETAGSLEDSEDQQKDGAFSQKLEVSYSFTHHLAIETEVAFARNHSNDDVDARKAELAVQYMPFLPNTQFMDFAVKAVYANKLQDKEADQYEIIGLFGKDLGDWQAVGNISFASDFGDHAHDERELESALQVRYKLNDSYKLGAEWFTGYGEFGDFGGWEDQEHLIGPVVYGKIGDTGLGWHAGVLKGISKSAPDYAFKWYLNYEFDL